MRSGQVCFPQSCCLSGSLRVEGMQHFVGYSGLRSDCRIPEPDSQQRSEAEGYHSETPSSWGSGPLPKETQLGSRQRG
jgi:hypothetical protein